MEYERNISYVNSDSKIGTIDIVVKLRIPVSELNYHDDEGRSGKITSSSAHDLLWELQSIYKSYDSNLLCLGLTNTVYPGGLGSDASLSLNAYQIIPDLKIKRVINIFRDINIDEIADIVSSKIDQHQIRKRILKNYDVGSFVLVENEQNKNTNDDVKKALESYLGN